MTDRRSDVAALRGHRHLVLRREPTPAEAVLWHWLKGSGLGVRFRRQHPIGPYIADFCCSGCQLVVELDGPGHADQQEADAIRSLELQRRGMTVLRFRNDEVLAELARVLRVIRSALQAQ
jgi:very-short-patch-repair endonuclease